MKVYLIVAGEYDERGVTHVVATEELAVQRAHCGDAACTKRHDECLHGEEYWPEYRIGTPRAEVLKAKEAVYAIFCQEADWIEVWEVEET